MFPNEQAIVVMDKFLLIVCLWFTRMM